MNLPIDQIKPDPNQPRRTFNEEKMKALEASIRTSGFRKEYPIILNGGNIIVDGERRWRAAKAAGIKEVPVEIKHNVTDFERLTYQLQSEGAELELRDKYEAWVKEYNLGKKFGETFASIAKKLGVPEPTYRVAVTEYSGFLELTESLKTVVATDFNKNYGSISNITREKDPVLKKKLAEKSAKEGWTKEKTREIRKALEEKPLRQKQILDMDYSDPYEGSGQWRSRLEVAKSNIDIEAADKRWAVHEHLEGQADVLERFDEHGLKLMAALNDLEIETFNPQTRQYIYGTAVEYQTAINDFVEKISQFMSDKKELIEGVIE